MAHPQTGCGPSQVTAHLFPFLKIKFLIATSQRWLAESEEELKSLLRKVKEESEKVGLKLNIQNINLMASGSSLHGK